MAQVSVIIATYNEHENIGRLMESLQNQTFGNFEIILVDNYSSDNTIKIARKFTSLIYQYGPERSAQRNFGLKKASGQYVLFLDADMTTEPNLLEECIKLTKSDPQLLALTIDEISKGASFLSKIKNLEKQLYLDQELIVAPRFFRKKDLEKIGGYDQNLIAGEDWDLAVRIQKLGKVGKISSKIYHHETQSLISDLKKKYYYALHIQKYAQKYPQIFKHQAGFARFSSLFKKPKMILAKPIDFTGLLFLKSAQYLVYLAAKWLKLKF